MNKIWLFIILLALAFGIVSSKESEMASSIFLTFDNTLSSILKMGGIIIIYNGIFQMAIDCCLVEKLSFPFKKIVSLLYKDVQKNSLAHQYICANVVANLLGLGLASTPLAIKALTEMKKDNCSYKSMMLFILLNVSCFTILPLTSLGIRQMYGSQIQTSIVVFLIVISFLTSLITIVITSQVKKEQK